MCLARRGQSVLNGSSDSGNYYRSTMKQYRIPCCHRRSRSWATPSSFGGEKKVLFGLVNCHVNNNFINLKFKTYHMNAEHQCWCTCNIFVK